MTDNNNNTIVPSTPSWMTEQRKQRRNNRRGYGRRSSIGLGSRGTPKSSRGTPFTASKSLQNMRGESSPSMALFGTPSIRSAASALDFDIDDNGNMLDDYKMNNNNEQNVDVSDVGDEVLGRSANARLQGNRARSSSGNNNTSRLRRPPRPTNHTPGSVDSLDQSARARLEHLSNSGGGQSTKDDNESDDQMMNKKKLKKIRLNHNLPRPPRSRAGSNASNTTSSSHYSTPKIESNPFEFGVVESEETITSVSTAASGNNSISRLANNTTATPMKGVVVNNVGGDAKRPKVTMKHRSNSNNMTAAAAAVMSTISSAVEENVDPSTNAVVTRRSSRLEQKNRMNNNSTMARTGLSSSLSMNNMTCNNDNEALTKKSSGTTRRSRKKRSASSSSTNSDAFPNGSLEQHDLFDDQQKPSTSRSTSGSFSSSNSSLRNNSSGSESFSSLARRNQNWASKKGGSSAAHKRSVSVASFPNNNYGTTPLQHGRSISCGGDLSSMYSTTSPDGRGTPTNPSTGGSNTSSRKRRTMDFESPPISDELKGIASEHARSRKAPPTSFTMDYAINEVDPTSLKPPPPSSTSEPMSLSSPPPTLSFGTSLNDDMMCLVENDDYNLNEKKKDGMRARLSSESNVDVDDDDNSTKSISSEDECDESDAEDDEGTPREMTDAEIFDSKSSYEDFKFLTKELKTWSERSQGRGASMGLNNGCIIAVPPSWTHDRRAKFSIWVAKAFPAIRVGSVGGTGGSFLKCADVKGKEVLARLLQILKDYKAGRLDLPSEKSETNAKTTIGGTTGATTLRLPMKPKSMRRSRSADVIHNERPMFSICDGMVGDLLSDDMKGMALEEKKSEESNTGSPSVLPQFNRSRSVILQPLASKIRNTNIHNLSPTIDDHGIGRPPRLSSESAITSGSDFMNQLHGMGSPSPPPIRFPGRKIRERLGRALIPARRPSFEKIRSSFERPSCLKPFESPHPRNNCVALGTPSSRMEIGLETPMPKQIESWGSRPVLGKDWGESTKCCQGIIDSCSEIFAKSWFTSEFHDNAELSAKYGMQLDVEDESSLFAFYAADAGTNADVDDDSEVASINGESLNNDEFPTIDDDEFPTAVTKRIGFHRCDSVGASALDLLHLDDGQAVPGHDRRRTMKLKKYARMSLCVSAASDFLKPKLKPCYRLSESPTKKKKRISLQGTPINSIMDSTAFSHVMSYLNEKELIHSASLVSSRFADVAAEALGNLMLVSVGCDLSSAISSKGNTKNSSESDSEQQSSIVKSMERTWPNLTSQFPWAQFLSDGAFKRVFKVWNNHVGGYEALSVMDVDAINDMGNLNLVGTELCVSTILSSVARRNICPNFVVTRGVFTCQHEPPSSIWGSKDDHAPRGTTYNEHHQSLNNREPTLGQCGNYQYIRMELCENGDVEEFIRNHPNKCLSPKDCQNLLFQMTFALHVAGDRFGLKHYDIKLLNFLLQRIPAKDPSIPDDKHSHVVLRYGVGSHVFRLRMHPSTANIAKLADYGTSIMRTDKDGFPISLGQFTTLENTPADYLILGNAAVQGYGHDCFGLGLCMLHLFTGHAPYEEILEEVVCPENLKDKLRRIWKQKSHNVIHSVVLDNDENGVEIEDQTLYDTLYRFLVLFGIPDKDKQFDIKKNGKVWRAINSTLLPLKSSRSRSKVCADVDVFRRDRKKFSLAEGTDKRIANARNRLKEMDGAMELLLSLVSFDPKTRATPLDVINSRFMANLIEDDSISYCEEDIVRSYLAYKT